MELSNQGSSVYHRFRGHVKGDPDSHNWVTTQTNSSSIAPLELPSSLTDELPSHRRLRLSRPDESLAIYEIADIPTNTRRGILMSSETLSPFESFFAETILAQSDLLDSISPRTGTAFDQESIEAITDLFDHELRNAVPSDAWEAKGRAYFASRVEHFVVRDIPLELILPAFPAKSSNGSKVASRDPDRGEELALRRLHSFVRKVENVYKPGAKLWIISDGHVFSDCIGVDDGEVDRYGEALAKMNAAIQAELGGPERIGFRSLVDLFDLHSHENEHAALDNMDIPEIDHLIDTKLTAEAELCRKILMAGCQSERGLVRARIDANDAAVVALYRGFSKFMLEDLDRHPATQNMSRSQRRKLSSKVAFEMIMRNQAYSNLVELLFPNHVRLSIHAHNNSGPKFGIQLFDNARVRATNSLEPLAVAATSVDLLHIPTPWHNCVVEVAGSPFLFVTKSAVVDQAVKAGVLSGGWTAGDGAGKGGYFQLMPAIHDESDYSSTDTLVEDEAHLVVLGEDKAAELGEIQLMKVGPVLKQVDMHPPQKDAHTLEIISTSPPAHVDGSVPQMKRWALALTHGLAWVRQHRRVAA